MTDSFAAAGPRLSLAREVAAWLAENAPEFELPGDRDLSPFAALTEDAEREHVALARRWQARKHEGGWAAMTLSPELGGRGMTRADEVVFTDEESRYHLPTHIYEVTTRMVLPTIAHWAPEKRSTIDAMVSGEHLWCQLFSEPEVGSDLASLRTRAVRLEDGRWQLSGQKVWTSWAFFADRGYLLARTGGAERYHDLTAFEVDMSSPGITVRRLRQVTGASTFNEVFLDDVVVPADAVIGQVGMGWQVAMTTLMNERLAVGADQIPYAELRAEAVRRGLIDDPVVLAALGDICARHRIVEQLRFRMLESVARGVDPGPEGSAAKLFLAESVVAAAELARRIIGADLMTYGRWSEFALAASGIKIAGGTDEIQKNIIADRMLGLPRPGAPSAATS